MMGSVLALQFQTKAKALMTRYATQTCQGNITLRTLVSDLCTYEHHGWGTYKSGCDS